MSEQQSPWKRKPRGRPWPPGVSGNPKGRPPGRQSRTAIAVEEGLRRSQMLDLSLPYESWGSCFIQCGRFYNKSTFQVKDPAAPPLPQLEMIDPRKPRQLAVWHRKEFWVQSGWPYDRFSLRAVRLRVPAELPTVGARRPPWS